MFGLSFAELVVIAVVALVVIGPKELPAVIRAVARTLAQFRNIAGEFRKHFDELTQEAELDALKSELTAMPTIIDLEGKEQRTYDIAGELEADKQRRKDLQEKLGTPEAQQDEGEGKA